MLREKLQDYLDFLEEDIQKILNWEEEVSSLDCCDNRELEVLQNVAYALATILLEDKKD